MIQKKEDYTVKPHEKLPDNRLTESQHLKAGALAKSLMSRPARPVRQRKTKSASNA